MDFKKLYRLGIIRARTALHVRPRGDLEAFANNCDLYRGRIVPAKPLAFEFFKGASGSTAHDFVSTSLTSLKLMSDHVVEVLRPFSGWAAYSVEVYDKHGDMIPGYHGLAVTGRCGRVDDSRSQARICPPPVAQGQPRRRWFGVYFDPATWDGSDIFLPEGTSHTFVTEAVKEALEQAKITNVCFTRLTEAENFSPALLFGDTQ